MIDALREVCALQPFYSPDNTAEMQERGRLIRRVLPEEFRALWPLLTKALGRFGAEADVDASDGIGRKTEAPWVRLFARGMAPTPRDGFYLVIHFAADGSAVFITVGCGSTVWANGTLTSVAQDELARRVGWARGVVQEHFATLVPFDEQISLGATARLPRTFERATALSHRIAVGDLNEQAVVHLLVQAAERLAVIYEAASSGGHLPSSTLIEATVEQLAEPIKAQSRAQGFGLTAPERRAVEVRAMAVARELLEAQGFSVTDRSAQKSFDFEAVGSGETLKIEVKGTTSDLADAVLMTANEVELHRNEKGSTGLIVVSGIKLLRGESPTGSGGEAQAYLRWDIDTWLAAPLAYKLSRPGA